MRVWRRLTAVKRLGQAHSIDSLLPNRKEGNLVVHCPCCIEPGVNMEEGWTRNPPHLRCADRYPRPIWNLMTLQTPQPAPAYSGWQFPPQQV